MSKFEFVAPCHFGLEAVLKKEIIELGYEIVQVEDGRVTFIGEEDALCRANIFLRTAERVLLKVAKFKAETYDELFEKTYKYLIKDEFEANPEAIFTNATYYMLVNDKSLTFNEIFKALASSSSQGIGKDISHFNIYQKHNYK